jgi:hypothetical protein
MGRYGRGKEGVARGSCGTADNFSPFLIFHSVFFYSRQIKSASRKGFEGRLPDRVRRVVSV